MISWRSVSKTVEELEGVQRSLSTELRRRKKEKQGREDLKKMAAKYGFKLVSEPGKPGSIKPGDEIKEIVKPTPATAPGGKGFV